MQRLIPSLAIFLLLLSGPALAQMPPDPVGIDRRECEAYLHAYIDHIRGLNEQASACRRRYFDTEQPWTTVRQASCGASMYYWGPDGCQSFADQAACAKQQGHSTYMACLDKTRNAQSMPDRDDFSRRIMGSTMSGVPGSLGRLAGGAALMNQPDAKRMSRYKPFVDLFRAMNDKDASLPEKVGSLAEFLGRYGTKGNRLSSELLNVAIKGALSTNKAAMEELTRELDRFSTEFASDRSAEITRSRLEARAPTGGGPAISEARGKAGGSSPSQRRQSPTQRTEARRAPSIPQGGGGGGGRYSSLQCSQLLAQIREYQRVLGAYDAQGLGGMIRQGIAVNQGEYNRGCR